MKRTKSTITAWLSGAVVGSLREDPFIAPHPTRPSTFGKVGKLMTSGKGIGAIDHHRSSKRGKNDKSMSGTKALKKKAIKKKNYWGRHLRKKRGGKEER